MIPEAAAASHGYNTPVVSGQVVIFQPLLTHDPTVYREDKTGSTSDGPSTSTDDDDDQMHPLGSVSWCTRYGLARKQTYSNQPIFLFPKQNGRRFD
jgi:hypothetical protein